MPVLNSSAIYRAAYDPATRVLKIWFTSGDGPYNYYGVPQVVYDGLIQASSKGTYFHQRIKEQYSTT
jgi:hypothetical protein